MEAHFPISFMFVFCPKTFGSFGVFALFLLPGENNGMASQARKFYTEKRHCQSK